MADETRNDAGEFHPLVAYLTAKAAQPHVMPHPEQAMESVRTAVHNGHQIVVRTRYEITVDGEPLPGQVEVGNNGLVYHHGLPNYGFPSAIGMVAALIDRFGSEFADKDGDVPPASKRHQRRRENGEEG